MKRKQLNSISPPPLEFRGDEPIEWEKFKEKLMFYFEMTNWFKWSERDKVGFLLHLMQDNGIYAYDRFTYADGESRLNLKNVLAKFDALYSMPIDSFDNSVVYNRFKFFSRSQMENEPVREYFTALLDLAETCEFDDEMGLIRDRLILGIKDKHLRECLFRHSGLRVNHVLDICQKHDAKKKEKVQDMDRLKKTKEAGRIKCSSCGFAHQLGNCPALGKTCRKCNKTGHLPSQCNTKIKRDDTKGVEEKNSKCNEKDSEWEVKKEGDSESEEEEEDSESEEEEEDSESEEDEEDSESEDEDSVIRISVKDINVKWKGSILPKGYSLSKTDPVCNFKFVSESIHNKLVDKSKTVGPLDLIDSILQ